MESADPMEKEMLKEGISTPGKTTTPEGPNSASPSVATPEKHQTKKRQNNGEDLNKKPKQRPKVKKHRPKVALDHGPPGKVQNARTPQPSTPKPKTPKLATEKKSANLCGKRSSAKKSDIKGSASISENINSEAAGEGPACLKVSCKRSLKFDLQEVDCSDDMAKQSLNFDLQEADHRDEVPKSCNVSPHLSLVNEDKYGFFKTFGTSKRSARKKKIYVKETSENNVRVYQRCRKRSVESSLSNRGEENPSEAERETIPDQTNPHALKIYQRRFRANQCQQNSRKSGPNFPKIYKKIRKRRTKATMFARFITKAITKAEDDEKRLNGGPKQATRRLGQKGVKKSKIYEPLVVGLGFDCQIEKEILQKILPTKGQIRAAISDPESFRCVMKLAPVAKSRGKRSKGFVRRRVFNSLTVCNFVQVPPPSLLNDFGNVLSGPRVFEPQDELVKTNADVLNKNQMMKVQQQLIKTQIVEKEVQRVRAEICTNNYAPSTVSFFHNDAIACEAQTFEEVQLVSGSENCTNYYKQSKMNLFVNHAAAYDNYPQHEDLFLIKEKCKERRKFRLYKNGIKDITRKLERMHINGKYFYNKQIVVRDQIEVFNKQIVVRVQKAHGKVLLVKSKQIVVRDKKEVFNKQIVVRDQKAHGEVLVVKSSPVKRAKQEPKVVDKLVDIGKEKHVSENLRMYNYLRHPRERKSDESEYRSTENEEWWRNEREVLSHRVDSFLHFMHLIQGNRKFTPWKGSVVDSVGGVFLTQNVSDFLSSSAFMNLCGKHPAKSESKEIVDGVEEVVCSQDSVGSNNVGPDSQEIRDETPNIERSTFRENLDSELTDSLQQFCSGEDDDSLLCNKTLDEPSTSHEPCTKETTPLFDLNVDMWEPLGVDFSGTTAQQGEQEKLMVDLISSLQSEVTTEFDLNAVNNDHGRKKSTPSKGKNKPEEEEKPKIDWAEMRRLYVDGKETVWDDKNMDAVDWDGVRKAGPGNLADVIAARGMNNVLAEKIISFLNRMVNEIGKIDLEWLRDVPPDIAQDFLLSIHGIGMKSMECVRLLTLHHKAFPVDTNVGRVASRLGWVPLKLPEGVPSIHLLNAYPNLDTIQKYLYTRLCTLDQEKLYELHYQMITFGKVFCTKRNPKCGECPMRAECLHYASAVTSSRYSLPEPKERKRVVSKKLLTAAADQGSSVVVTPPAVPLLEFNTTSDASDPYISEINGSDSRYNRAQNCEPIIEVPASPEPMEVPELRDIEDFGLEPDDPVPTIRLNRKVLERNLQNYIETNNLIIPGADTSNVAIALAEEAASVHLPEVKFVERLRTVHQVFELPDSHPLLLDFEKRDADDPYPYLFAIWPTGETSEASGQPKNVGNSTESRMSSEDPCCSSSCSYDSELTVKGTILTPIRTAMRGRFALNATYFQVNEVVADYESSMRLIDVPKAWIWNLARRSLHCGTSVTALFSGASVEEIQYSFQRGFNCTRAFDRRTRLPKPLSSKFHRSTAAGKTKAQEDDE